MKPSNLPTVSTVCASAMLATALWTPLVNAELRATSPANSGAAIQSAPTQPAQGIAVQPQPSPAPSIQPPAVQTSRPVPSTANMLEQEMIGGIDWQNNVVYGIGDGVPPAQAINPAQARVRAKRAAIDEAMARLLETVKEVRVDAESTTRNFISEHRMVGNRVSGMIRNAEVVEIRQADDGSFQVKMAMPLNGPRGLSAVLLPAQIHKQRIQPSPATGIDKVATVSVTRRPIPGQPPAPPAAPTAPAAPVAPVVPGHPAQAPAADATPAPASNAAEAKPAAPQPAATTKAPYTALVIDARGLPAIKAMFPRILTTSGEVLYDVTIADPNATVAHGLAGYGSSLDAMPRAGANPLTIKAVDVSGSAKADLVIADEDAAALSSADATSHFLRQANVLVLTD